MIKVTKGLAPLQLSKSAGSARRSLEADYNANTASVKSGSRKLKFKDSLYGHKAVRSELGRLQNGKCCYCEVRIPIPYALQHVEHYRPKSQSRQSRNSKPITPGYYWLAYEWENLFLSCHFCNSSSKGDLFPLTDDASRAMDHSDDIAKELPQILSPGGPFDPSDHIEFHEEVPKGTSIEGRATVDFLRLDSAQHELRLETLGRLRNLRREISILKLVADPSLAALIREKREELLISQRTSSPFSSMARHFLRKNPIP